MNSVSVKLTFYIQHAHTLKEKRTVVRRIIDKIRHKYNASVAEVDTQDVHQTLTLGIAVVSGGYSHARNMLDDIVRFAERNTDAELISAEYIE